MDHHRPHNDNPPLLHPPSSTTPSDLPTLTQLVGNWYITHTTSEVWRDKRNVVLTYTSLDPSSSSSPRPQLDDLITYQALTSAKTKTMRGTDTPDSVPDRPRAWTWRGNGMLKFVTSRWEILGFGGGGGGGEGAVEGGHGDHHHPGTGKEDWLVVWAQKSIFTPAVLNVCTRHKEGMGAEWVEGMKEVCRGLGDEGLGKTVDNLYRVAHE